MNMSWDNYMMYLASIPTSKSESEDKTEEDQAPEEVSLFNLHD